MLPAWRAERAAANSPASSASVEAVVVAQESETSARLCEGLDLDSADQTVLFASVVQSCRLWLDSDCIDTTKEQPFVLAARPDNGKLMLRSRSCADRKTPLLCPVGRGWCLECERAAQSRKNLLHVCGWAFKMDQVRLLHLLLQRRTEDAQDLLSEMAAADYQQHVRVDLRVLREMDYTAMLHRVRNLFASIRQDRRNPALAHFVKARVGLVDFSTWARFNTSRSIGQWWNASLVACPLAKAIPARCRWQRSLRRLRCEAMTYCRLSCCSWCPCVTSRSADNGSVCVRVSRKRQSGITQSQEENWPGPRASFQNGRRGPGYS